MKRFVIQEHRTSDGTHYDLMLEHGRKLATWSFPKPQWTKAKQTVTRLTHHRKRYLTYEGDISGDRGSVKIVDSGVYELIARTEHLWLIVAVGRRLRGPFVLVEVPQTAFKQDNAGRGKCEAPPTEFWTYRRLS